MSNKILFHVMSEFHFIINFITYFSNVKGNSSKLIIKLSLEILHENDFLCPHIERSGGILFYRCPSVSPSGCLHKLNVKT